MSTVQSVFYDTSELSLEQKIDVLKYAKSVCSSYRIDQLYSNEWIRTPTKMSFNGILSKLKLDPDSHFVIIHRPKMFDPENEHFEIGFSTSNLKPTYFLFIYGDLPHLDVLMKKYNLEVLQ